MKLNKMNVVITGANGAMGSELVKYFNGEVHCIIGTVRGLVKSMEINNRSAIFEMNLLDEYSIKQTLAIINEKIGKIHVIINVAGGFSMGSHIEENNDLWNYMYNTNFITTLNVCRQALPIMKKNKFGKIINFGAQAAKKCMPLAGPYCVSKAAVHALTQTISLEAPTYITCNAILPGIIDTIENRTSMPDANHKNWATPNKICSLIEKIITTNIDGELISV
tara:strand:- start:57 stop:722 length:666 start_codon:yes stop_codon:yes gene_type:complete